MKSLYAITIPAVIAFLIAMTISLTRWPMPQMHDDFSNLLVADTLLHGRLSNPTPPCFESFETFHVVMTPSYVSKFPIGPGLFLAVGKFLLGSYAAGLWLCAATATAAITWMLLGCFSPRWAAGIGTCFAIHPNLMNGWAQEFTHGWLPIAGVSLVLGGVLRIHKVLTNDAHLIHLNHRTRLPYFLIAIAAGCVIVLFSRPFDGGIVCIMLVASLCPKVIKCLRLQKVWTFDFAKMAIRTIGPSMGIVAMGIGGQLFINAKTTGNWAQLPYQLHEQQYGVAPLFVWGKPNEPTIGHRFPEFSLFHREYSMKSWEETRSVSGYSTHMLQRVVTLVQHWGMGLALLPMLVLTWRNPRRKWGWLIVISAIAILIINCIPWIMPAYVASLIPIAVLLTTFAIRRLICWLAIRMQTRKPESQGSRSGFSRLNLEYGVLATIFLFQALSLSATCIARAHQTNGWEQGWGKDRADLVSKLQSMDGKHLVLVHYETDHNIHAEWVYNQADIPNAKIIWARDADSKQNKNLLESYPNRNAWKLSVPSLTFQPLVELSSP